MRFALEYEELAASLIDLAENPGTPRNQQEERHHVCHRNQRSTKTLAQYPPLFCLKSQHRQAERNEHRARQQSSCNETRGTLVDDQRRDATVQLREQQPKAEEDECHRCRKRHSRQHLKAVEVGDAEYVSHKSDKRHDQDASRKCLRTQAASQSVQLEKAQSLPKQQKCKRCIDRHLLRIGVARGHVERLIPEQIDVYTPAKSVLD